MLQGTPLIKERRDYSEGRETSAAAVRQLLPEQLLPGTEWSSSPGRWQQPAAPTLSGVRTRPWRRSWTAHKVQGTSGRTEDTTRAGKADCHWQLPTRKSNILRMRRPVRDLFFCMRRADRWVGSAHAWRTGYFVGDGLAKSANITKETRQFRRNCGGVLHPLEAPCPPMSASCPPHEHFRWPERLEYLANMGSQRDISLVGRIFFTKTEECSFFQPVL